jgi:sugar phosphate isomerase/epimerase
VEETFAANKKFYAPILEHAEKYGVNILVENFNKMHVEGLYWIDNATDLLELIDYIDHPLFHAVWDTGHGNLQETPQDEEIRRLGHHICALHVQDNMGDRDAHLLPFLGTMNIDAVMNGLREIGYDGYFTFEVGGIFTRPNEKRPYAADTRLAKAPLSLKCAAERYLYELGKCVLEAYDCYEE